jgi:hypothetical protein
MAGWRHDGWSYKAIADELNRRRVKPKMGQRWYPSAVRAMLRRLEAET